MKTTVAAFVGASMIVHGSILFIPQSIHLHKGEALREFQKKIDLQEKNELELEFVEAPRKIHPQSPSRSIKRFSNQDALNQDLTKNKSLREAPPAVKNAELGNQIEQRQHQPSQRPSLPSQPQPAIKKNELSASEEQNKEQESGESQQAQPQSEAKALIQGSPGQDKIITQEMAQERSSGAKFYGFTSFEATGSGMGQYMKNLKERIWFAWYPYLAFKYPQDYRGANALVSVVLNKKGEVESVRILESQGSPLFAAFCVESVRKASGFGPLPEELLALIGKDELELKFRFHYY